MSEGIEQRLRDEYRDYPNTITKIYPGDVLEVIDGLRAELEQTRKDIARNDAALRRALPIVED